LSDGPNIGGGVEFDQKERTAELVTPLGRNVLVLTRFDGSEGLSEHFEYHVEAVSKRQDIDFDKLIGKNCHVKLKSYGNATRYFNGVLVEADWSGVQHNLNAYRLVLRPWFWLLGRKATCRIFKEKSVFDIVEEVFQDGGFKDFQIKASRSDYEKIEYCVQYRESDLAFVSRLLEEWGVYTHFEHDAQRHQLMLCDSRSCHKPVKAGGGIVPFLPLSGSDRHDREHVSSWRGERRFRTGKFATNDFDYMKPTANLQAEQKGSALYEKGTLESYDYPGRYTERDLGQRRTKVRLEAEQADDKRKHASGDAASLFPGALATLQNHPSDNGEYLVVRATHRIEAETYRSSGNGGGEVYSGTYEFQPVDRPFRAPIVTPRPLVHGPQTALVVTRKGRESEEIDVDEEGRIFVQFHWNRDRDRISRPVRVAQQWSGKSWGWQVIPRVGQEVVVEFLEGDPDQPLVVGTVYNKDYPYPFKLPDEKTISGVKTDSTKGHGGYNKLTFDDKKSSETIALRAEKDLEAVVQHAETREIGVTFETPQGKPSRSTTLKNGDEKLKVESGDWNVDIAEKIHIKAGTQIVIEVGASKITMSPSSIKIEAGEIKVQGTALIEQQAPLIKIN